MVNKALGWVLCFISCSAQINVVLSTGLMYESGGEDLLIIMPQNTTRK